MSLPEPTKLVGPRYGQHWEESETEELKERHARGESAAHIAKAMGLYSRNQVIGRLFRLGLAKKRPPRPAPRPLGHRSPRPDLALQNRARGPRRVKKGSTLTRHTGEWISNPAPPQPVRGDQPTFALAKFITLDELNDSVCHWPMWGNEKQLALDARRYCGCKVEYGLPYCSFHAGRAYAGAVRPNTWMMPKS